MSSGTGALLVRRAAFYAGRFLARHGVAGHEVECQYEQGADGAVTAVALTLCTDAVLPDAVRTGALRAIEHCAVVRSIRGGLHVTASARSGEVGQRLTTEEDGRPGAVAIRPWSRPRRGSTVGSKR